MMEILESGDASIANRGMFAVLCPSGGVPPRFVDLDQRRSARLASRAKPSRLASLVF
jgi:hypothetical protein